MDKELKIDWQAFAEGAGHWLELFDSSFALDAIPLQARPLKAAMWFVRKAMPELPDGGQKDENYFHKEWFSALVVAIRQWYDDRYGAEALVSNTTLLSGLILLHGTPIRLDIRETVSKVEIEGEQAWCFWPDSIHETETVLSFLPTKPNLNALAPAERARFEEKVAAVVKRTRSMNLALQSASDLPQKGKQMVPSVSRHLEKGVADILSLNYSNAAVAIWELHLAVEKAFKIYLHQHRNTFPTHDLSLLSKRAQSYGLTVTKAVLEKLPFWKTASNYRYADNNVQIEYAVEIYDAALQLVDEIAAKLRRKLVINNAGFLLQKPKWVGRT